MRRLALIAPALLLAACATTPHTTAAPKTVINAAGKYLPIIDVDGTYVVGLNIFDIQIGTYRNAGGTPCHWARLRSLDPRDVIESGTSSSPQVVHIQFSDTAFLTHNCGTWQLTSLF